MEDPEVDDMVLGAATLEGVRRCVNSRRQGTSVIFPAERNNEWGNHLMESQHRALKPNQLAIYQLELLKRADALLQFLDANLGGSEEFPLVLLAESEETLEAFHDQVASLRSAAGLLMEV